MAIATAKFVSFLLVVVYVAVNAETDNFLNDFSHSNRQFSSELFKQVAKEQTSNFLTCPISVETVMALAGAGASGDTLTQIQRGLNLPENATAIRNAFTHLTPFLRGNELFALNAANKIYIKDTFEIRTEYIDTAESVFDASIERIDFNKNVEAAKRINHWVELKTNNKIHELVDSADLGPLTKLILVNALHFKGQWRKPFDSFDTIPRPFYVEGGKTETVEMMQITEYFNYYENKELDAQFLEMPYQGGDVSMVFVLPNKKDGLKELEQKAEQIFTPQKYSKVHIRVQIPKFSMETSLKLKPILENMGIKKAFTPEAELAGIAAGGGSLYVDKVIQKTFINVTEIGTEAAAATSSGVITLSIPPSALLEFKADHSFLLVLQLLTPRRDPIVLFTGRYTGPGQHPSSSPSPSPSRSARPYKYKFYPKN